MEYIITVDEKDRPTGREEKVKCHLGDGILHRAYMVMVRDGEGKLLLARRSPEKMLWPGFWDGTVASHPHPGEEYEGSALARLKDELGIERSEIQFLFKFQYQISFNEVGAENEICAVLLVDNVKKEELRPNPSEVSEVKFVNPGEVAGMKDVCPWLLIALDLIAKIDSKRFPLKDQVL